jgi:hypothetical protein
MKIHPSFLHMFYVNRWMDKANLIRALQGVGDVNVINKRRISIGF